MRLANGKRGRAWGSRGEFLQSRERTLQLKQFCRTFRDKTDDDDIMDTLADIADELGKDLEKLQYAGKTVTVKYKVCWQSE